MGVRVGFTLQPEERFLELCAPLLEEVDYFELAPEVCWYADDSGTLQPNGFHARFLNLAQRTGKPFVGHGVGFSLGTADRDPRRDERWLAALERDQRLFDFQWYSDHLGATVVDGHEVALPLPLPHTAEAERTVRAALDALASVLPDVGFENTAFPFWLDDPLEEADWITRLLEPADRHLVLDVHNLATNAENAGFDPRAYASRLPLDRVIEVHVSGGSASDPAWLPSGRVLRLDSHDDAVPARVWALAEELVPQCPGLRGVTLERMEGTVEERDVPVLREELRRARRLVEGARG